MSKNEKDTVKVVIRLRPLNENEKSEDNRTCVKVDE